MSSKEKKSKDSKSKDKSKKEKVVKKSSTKSDAATPTKASDASASPKELGSNPLPMGPLANQILTHYDETNGIAVSRAADVTGSNVVPLTKAYSDRYDRLIHKLTTKLRPKKEQLVQILRQLEHASIEVNAMKSAIETETKVDTEQILQRLNNMEAMRQSNIAQEVLKVNADLEAIDRLIRRVDAANRDQNATNNSGITYKSAVPGVQPLETVHVPRAMDMVELIHQYADLDAKIESLSKKPLSVRVDFPTDDFPRETAERLEVNARCDKFLHAVSVKDHMLWLALQDKAQAEERLADEQRLSQGYANELTQWAEMAQELQRQKLVAEQERENALRECRELKDLLRKHNIYHHN